MAQEDEGDASYLAMLNNPAINPPNAGSEPTPEMNYQPLMQEEITCDAAKTAKDTLENAADGLVLTSESDESFQWFHVAWDHDRFPEAKELVEFGFEDAALHCRTKTLEEFLGPLAMVDESHKGPTFSKLWSAYKQTFGDKQDETRVYLIGETEITILILGLVKEADTKDGEQIRSTRALAGLQSIQVET